MNSSFMKKKSNAAVDQLRTFREYGQLHLHSAVFLPKFTTVLFTIYLSCANLLSDCVINGIRKSVFTVTVTNNGLSDAVGVSVNDVLPTGYSFVSASASTGTWSAPDWTVGSIANTATATLTLTATVKSSGEYINTATLSATTADLT